MLQILNPMQLNLHSKAIGGKEHHVDLQLSDIVMNVSPATIRIITATLSSLSASPVSVPFCLLLQMHLICKQRISLANPAFGSCKI